MKIIDYCNDIEEDVEIEELGLAGVGYNAPMKVRVNGVLGFKKKSVNSQVFDSFEYLIVQLGKLLNIKVADTYFFDDGSIFSKSIINDDEEFLTGEDILKCLPITKVEIEYEREKRDRFHGTLKSIEVSGNTKYIVETPEQIVFAVNGFIDIIKKLNVSNEQEIVDDYIKMCFLDTLTGNKDRVSGNYGLVRKDGNYSFAPLFDSSTISYPGIDDNYMQLNNYLIDRNSLYNYLLSNHYEALENIFSVDRERVIDKMITLSDKTFSGEEDQNNKEWFRYAVIGNLDHYLNNTNVFFTDNGESKTNEDSKVEDSNKCKTLSTNSEV